MTGLVGSIIEAWDELRIHKVRVLLSLIGVAVAVAAITGVTAAVAMLKQGFAEQAERQNGRAVTIMIYANPTGPSMTAQSNAALATAYSQALARYSISWSSRDWQTQASVKFQGGSQDVQLEAVDAAYGTIYRVQMTQGRWFSKADETSFAPQLVVNKAFLKAMGVTDLSSHPTVLIGSTHPVRAQVIGVRAEPYQNDMPQAVALYDPLMRWGLVDTTNGQPAPNLDVWVPQASVDQLSDVLKRDVQAAAPGWMIDVQDNRSWSTNALDGATKWVALGVGGFSLLLGGLGLVNISLTTVRYRIREIGIRRSFGATSGRVFFGVLMESVVATVVAGLVGVVLAIVLIKNIPVDRMFGGGLQDMPPFPVSAAAIGMAAAVGVGALAGLIPALVAVRVKVIDAIRY